MEKENSVRWPTIILAFAMVFLYSLGIYGVIRFFILHPEALLVGGWLLGFVGELISRNLRTVTYLLIGLVAVTIISVPLILRAMAKFGRKVMIFVIFAPAILTIGVGLVMATAGFLSGMPFLGLLGLPFIGLGGVMFLFLYRQRKHVYLAGNIFELSARAVAMEMGTLVPSLLFGLFSVLSVIMGVAAGFLVQELLMRMDAWVQEVVFFLIELGYAWLLLSFMYVADGTIIGIIDDWYRNPTMDKANLKNGFAKVRRVIRPVIQLAFVMAVARTARNRAESEEGNRGIGAILFYVVSVIAYGLVQFVTYFTLPAMVIEGTGFKDSVKRSYTLVWRHCIDVILAFMGIDGTYALFMVAMLALYGTSGAAAGWLLIAPATVTTADPIFVSIFSVVAFILVGFIPAYVLFRPMKAAYNTILYEYAKDMETGHLLPSRMPPDLGQQFQGIIQEAQTQRRISRWAEPKFPEEELVTKIKSELKEAKTEGVTKYIRSELYGEVKEGAKEAGLTNDLCEHLRQIGIDATLLEAGSPGVVEGTCIKVEGRNINFVQVQSLPSTGGLRYHYHYVVLANVEGLEGNLKAEVKPPAYWKLDLNEKRVVDFQWEGGYLAQLLNADSDLKNMLLKGGLDKLVIRPDRGRRCVRIVHMLGTWPPITIGSATIAVGRKAFPTLEDFEAYDRIANTIGSIVKR